ncbi:hypothetical protein pb186bvf_005527 [Paramecium bursaria]
MSMLQIIFNSNYLINNRLIFHSFLNKYILKQTQNFIIYLLMNDSQWRLQNPYFYRDKSYSIFKYVGDQSLKRLKPKGFKRSRQISVAALDKEKINLNQQNKKGIDFSLPKIEFQINFKELTIDEYEKRLSKRMEKYKHQQKLELPPLECWTRKYSIKTELKNMELKKLLQKFDYDKII